MTRNQLLAEKESFMTKKDYQKFAEGFRFGKPHNFEGKEIQRGFQLAVTIVVDILAADNSRFNRKKFYHACGLEPGEDGV